MLVVEDEPIVRMVMVEALEAAGLMVLEASTGFEACYLIDDSDDIDLLVTDLNLPGWDGVEVVRRARMRDPELPVSDVSARMELLEVAGVSFPLRTARERFSLSEFAAAVVSIFDEERR